MDSLLSQDEIDSLLAQAAEEPAAAIEGALEEMVSERPAGGADPRRFDFTRPYSISRNFDKNLRNIADSLGKSASLLFSNQFRANCLLEFKRIELQTFGEWSAGIPHPTCLCSVSLAPLKGSVLLHLDLALGFAFVKRLLGGPAEPETRLRDFTEIEAAIVRGVVLKLLDQLKAAAARLVALDPKFLALENNPSYLQTLPPGESVVVLDYLFHLDSLEGALNICFPIAAFEPVRALFDPEESGEPRPAQEIRRDRQTVLDVLRGTDTELVVKLGETSLTLDQVLRLEEGDLIRLDKPADSPLLLEIENKPLFLGVPGRVREKRALRLIERLAEE